MARQWDSMNYSERAVFDSATLTPATGTETIASVTVTLKDVYGNVAGGLNATPIVQGGNGGWTVGAQAGPFAWFTLDPTGLGLPVPTVNTPYSLSFVITDSLGNRYESTIIVTVKPDGL